jgi:hypothetical protein
LQVELNQPIARVEQVRIQVNRALELRFDAPRHKRLPQHTRVLRLLPHRLSQRLMVETHALLACNRSLELLLGACGVTGAQEAHSLVVRGTPGLSVQRGRQQQRADDARGKVAKRIHGPDVGSEGEQRGAKKNERTSC